MQTLTKELERNLASWGQKLLEAKGGRDQLKRNLDKETAALEAVSKEQQLHKQAHTFMMSELSERRAQAIDNIQAGSTMGMRMIYDNDYALRFDTFDEKRSEEGIASYKMEIRVDGTLDGVQRSFILQGGKGGGLHDAIALTLRESALTWLGYEGFIMFDEAYKFVSRDEKIGCVAELMRQNADLTGRQYIFSTHMTEAFAPVADVVIHLVKKDGIVQCEYLDPRDIVEIEEEYGAEEEDD
ncbi:MAG: hypothetical protein JSS66_05340 [Armatimonadetes bacterium]|nr:hypothetical protein [Armatimonadota bacterium]